MRQIGDHIAVQEGGRWGADNRRRNVDAVIGILQKHFRASSTVDPAVVHWITQLENLLIQSYTEQSAYDFKQGFVTLDGHARFDEGSFTKILKICVGIANMSKGQKGYVLVGVAEREGTAAKIEALFGSKPLSYASFFITGVDHEIDALEKSHDQFFQIIVDKIMKSSVSEPLRSFIAANLKPIRYYDKTVYVFGTAGQQQPSLFNNTYYDRKGAQLFEVPAAEFGTLFQRFS